MSNSSHERYQWTHDKNFYQERIENIEQERKIYSNYISRIQPSNSEYHMLEWEAKQHEENALSLKRSLDKLDNEINNTRLELADAQLQVLDSNKVNTIRKKQINKLLELVHPVEKDITYVIHDLSNGKHEKNAKRGNQNDESYNDRSLSDHNRPYRKLVRDGEMFELEKQLNETTNRIKVSTSSILKALGDADDYSRKIQSTESAMQFKEEKQKVMNLISEIDKVDYQKYLTTSEILRLRLSILITQRQEYDEMLKTRAIEEHFINQKSELMNNFLASIENSKLQIKKEINDVKLNYKSQLQLLNKRIHKLSQHKNSLLKQESELNDPLNKLKLDTKKYRENYQKLKKRNSLELEGYQNELNFLKQKFVSLKKHHDSKRYHPNKSI